MNKYYFILMGLSMLVLTSCRKNITKEYPEFEGTWFDAYRTLKIDDKGWGEYKYGASTGGGVSVSVSSEASGKLKIKDDALIIGRGLFRIKFDIDAYPTEVFDGFGSSNHYIVLDGDTLYKSPCTVCWF